MGGQQKEAVLVRALQGQPTETGALPTASLPSVTSALGFGVRLNPKKCWCREKMANPSEGQVHLSSKDVMERRRREGEKTLIGLGVR